MKFLTSFLCAILFFPLISCTKDKGFDSTPVSSLDLTRFLGKWYEIARYDHSFERGLDNVTAEYSLREDGMVRVLNSGWDGDVKKVAEGKAKCPDPDGNPAHLKVSFFLFFYSDYNVMFLDPDYRYVLIGSKSSRYLWILSRTPDLDDDARSELLAEASRRGYDTGSLIWVDQSRNLL